MSTDRIIKTSSKTIRFILLAIFAFAMFIPFYWLIISSFKTESEIFTVPVKWLPDSLYLGNYINAFTAAPFHIYYFNSIKICVIRILGCLFVSSLTAFAFAKLRFKGKNQLFLVYLATIMLPGQVTIVPTYLLMSKLGWNNTHLPLTVVLFFDAYVVFMLRQFFVTIPDSILEAAKIDGASYFKIFISIILPVSKSALSSMAILLFIWSWNDVLGPLIFINTQDLLPISLGMNVFKTRYNTRYGPLFAASAISQIPMLIIYISGQKYFEQGIATSGIKG